jgi:threonine aldolase
MPDFRSDTVTRPTAAMRAAIAGAEVGDDVFADDPSINRLQAHAAELLGFEDALFASSGTQTNLMGLLSHCERGDEAIVGQLWHTYRWEAGGMAVLGSIQPQPLENAPDGTLDLRDKGLDDADATRLAAALQVWRLCLFIQ